MKTCGMRALVVEPHDVNELIFASYLSHPFPISPNGDNVPSLAKGERNTYFTLTGRRQESYRDGYQCAILSIEPLDAHFGHLFR